MRQHLKGQQQQLGDNEPQLQKQLSDRLEYENMFR